MPFNTPMLSMLQLRSALVPIQNATATVLNWVFMAMIFGGFLFRGMFDYQTMLIVYILCYGVFSLFALVTLPVEFDASKRALAWVKTRNVVTPNEYNMAQDSLKWAAMTYVVAAIGAITTLIYYVLSYVGMSGDD
jgi:uncharacterized protein